jgi:hypothetical protein
MKRKFIIFFVLFFSFLFFPLSKNQAQTITPSPKLTITPLTNNTTDFEVLVDLLKIMFSVSGNKNTLPPNQKNQVNPSGYSLNISKFPDIKITPDVKVNPDIKITPDIKVTPDVNGLIYYPQCEGPYDNYPLPRGGTLCEAGCGPTTVAMILASYVDKKINPPLVVEEYRKKGYYLGPDGSYYSDAKKILKSYNLKIAPIFEDNQKRTIDQIMTEFGEIVKNYQNYGWTFFALANFCKNGCGHYFWIIKIDESLNIWAYDPAYDIKLPKPINHKVRKFSPRIRVLLAVKK